MTQFQIEVNGHRGGVLIIDGEDVSHRVSGFCLSAGYGEPSVLEVAYLESGGVVQGDADIVHKVSLLGLLKIMDELPVAEIEAEALNRLTWAGGTTVVSNAIEVIKELLTNAARSDVSEELPGG